MQFYFIRHAQSANNALYDETGSSQGRSPDPGLTSLGLLQAQILGDFLKGSSSGARQSGRDPKNLAGFGITHVYCSLMLRSIQTGTAVADSLNLPLNAWTDIHEEGGIYLEDEATGDRKGLPGVTRSYLKEHFPNLVIPSSLGENGWWNRPMEDFSDRIARAQRVFKKLVDRHGGTTDHVVMVSHGGFYNLLMHVILNIPLDDRTWFVMNNVGISRIDFEIEQACVYMNRTDFLPAELIT